jgi:hypothetical protein
MPRYNFKKIETAFTLSLLSVNDSYSYAKSSQAFSGVSSYQLKRFLDRDWDPNKALEDVILSLDIDWSSGWLMIDDTLIEKPYAEKIEGVYWLYSNKNGGYIPAINVTVLAWSDGKQTIPIRFWLYQKDENGKAIQTKNDFALEAVQYAFGLGIRPKFVCFDSKFPSKKMLNYLDANQCVYYCQLPCNRSFNGQQLKDTRFQPLPQEGFLKGVGHKVSVTKHCKKYFATNATGKGVTRQQIVNHYRVRWGIEDLFRALKQVTHFQECKSRSFQAQRRYILMCLKAFLLLQQQNASTIYQAKTQFQQKYFNLKVKADKALRKLAA